MATKIVLSVVVVAISLCGVVDGLDYAVAGLSEPVFTGAECVQVEDDPGILTRTSMGIVSNTDSSDDLRVLCPLIRWDENEMDSVTVKVNDNHASQAVQCRVTCYAENGSASTSTSYGSSANGSYQPIAITSGITEYTEGRCFLDCTIPDVEGGTSAIISYFYVQN